MKALHILKCAFALGLWSLAFSAGAAAVSFTVTGLVTANNPNVLTPGDLPSPAIGSTFIASFTVDDSSTSGLGSNCVAISACWSDNAASWNWDGLNVVTGGPGSEFRVFFDIVDNLAGSGQDELTITLKGDISLVAELHFSDSSGSAFETAGSNLLPSFSLFDSGTYSFQPACFGGIACFFSRRHSGDIVNPAVIPLPATAYLLATALGTLLLGGRARRKTPPTH